MKHNSSSAIKETVFVYADGIHDDSEAYRLIALGKAVGILADGRLLLEVGGTLRIKGEIDLTE